MSKKNNFIVLTIVIFIVGLFITLLTGCGGKIKLDAPDKFKVEENVLSWNAVQNAQEYIIRVNDKFEYESKSTSFNLMGTFAGINKVQVRAKGYKNYQQSDFGETLYIKQLEKPTSIWMGDSYIYWDRVENAIGYKFCLYFEEKLVFSKNLKNTSIEFNEVAQYIQKNLKNLDYCVIGVTAISDGQNTPEENAYIFATIDSKENKGYTIQYRNQVEKPYSLQFNQDTQTISWRNIYYANGYNITIKDRANQIIFTKNNHKANTLDIKDKELQTAFSNARFGSYTISVQAMKTSTPKWVLEDHIAIYTEYDSDITESTIEFQEEKLPQVTNIRFTGETSYLQNLSWNKLLGAKSYTVSLINPKGQTLYTQDVESGAYGIYLQGYFNKIIGSIKEAGEHRFSIIAKPDRDTFYIYKGRVVQFTQESKAQFFVFNVELSQKIETPIGLKIGGKYVNSVVYWEKSKNAATYYVTVEDSNGNIIYDKACTDRFDWIYYYLIDEHFYKRVNKTGEYTMKIYGLGGCNITDDGIYKFVESDPLIAVLHYDATTQKLTIKSTYVQEKFIYQNSLESLFLGQQAIEHYSFRKYLL